MKNCVIITGPQAVGKMAVGMALKEKEDYKLFHNHMTIELVKEVYGYLDKSVWPMVTDLRAVIFNNVCKQPLKGFVFTYMWAFNYESDHQYINDLIEQFQDEGWRCIIVELEADMSVRLERNRTPLRLEQKATKRDLEWSDGELVASMDKYRLNSDPGEISHPYYLRINNESKDPDLVAEEIMTYIHSL